MTFRGSGFFSIFSPTPFKLHLSPSPFKPPAFPSPTFRLLTSLPPPPPKASLMSLSPFFLNPNAPFSQPPFSFWPSRPNFSLPAPTVSETLAPPPGLPRNWCVSFRVRDARQDVLPARRLSACWWPVALEL